MNVSLVKGLTCVSCCVVLSRLCVQLDKYLRGKRLTSISAGKAHYGVTTRDGKLLLWGANHDRQLALGYDSSITFMPKPLEIKTPFAVKTVACAEVHSVAITVDGRVLTWGSGGSGQLGVGGGKDLDSPTLVEAGLPRDTPVVSIAVSAHNTAAITGDGRLYTWGAGGAGQLGDGRTNPRFEPVHVEQLPGRALVVSLGNRHALAVTDDGRSFTWGHNGFGQCGVGDERMQHASPQPVRVMDGKTHAAVHAACGENVSFVVTRGGELWGWGGADSHQLPGVPESDIAYEPVRIVLDPGPKPAGLRGAAPASACKVVRVAAALDMAVALVEGGDLYYWGYPFKGQPPKLQTALREAKFKASLISCGHTALLIA
jgi:alpha-tubulin suppressor-like RCC1 family protein